VSRADAELVARDRALPGLAVLLDPARFASTLAASLRDAGADDAVGGADLGYLRYKPETSCLAAYRVDVGGRTVHVHAKAHAAHDGAKYAKARERLGRHDGGLGVSGVAWDDVLVAVRGFPNDLVLRRLPKVATTSERRQRFLTRVAPDIPSLWAAELDVLKYKAERRFVARLDVAGRPQALLKLYGAGDFLRARAGLRSVADVDGVGATRLLGGSRSAGALLTSWHAGVPLHDLDGEADVLAAAGRAAGASLRRLHRRPADALAGAGRGRHARAVLAAGEAVAFLVPPLAQRVRRLAADVVAEIDLRASDHVALHGDFSSDQVIVAPAGTVTVIDFDEAALGPSGVDLGTFVAQLERDRTLGRSPRGRAEALGSAVMEGYGSTPDGIGAFVAAGILRLAPHVFRERDDAWPERTEAVVAAAERAAARSDSEGIGS
jgi:aminoglycoside phosphotransferase